MKLNLKYVVIAVILLAIGFLAGFYTKDSTNKTQTTITYQVNTANDCSWANGKIDLDRNSTWNAHQRIAHRIL